MEYLNREIAYFQAWENRNPVIYISEGTLKRLTGLTINLPIEIIGCKIKIFDKIKYGYIFK
jgi:hypothetical protein